MIRLLLALLLLLPGPSGALAREPGAEDLRRAFPGATAFGPFEGDPPAATAYRDGEARGWVFSSWMTVRSTGYSGARLDLLVGLDRDGRIAGAAILEQTEPIMVTGATAADFEAFVARHAGRDVRAPMEVGRGAGARGGLDAVAGATMTSLVLSDAVLKSARAVARSRGLLAAPGRIDLEGFAPASWGELVAEGSLGHLLLPVATVEAAFARRGQRLLPEASGTLPPEAPFLELWAGLATPARVLRNLLGERAEARLRASLPADAHLLFVAARGLGSIKGTAWRRSGRFERLALVQGERRIELTAAMHHQPERLALDDAPDLRETALFALPPETGFRAEEPWRLQLALPSLAEPSAVVLFELPWRPPERLLLPPEPAPPPAWIAIWRDRAVDLSILAVGLLALSALLTFQDWVVARRRLWSTFRLAFLLFTLLFIGFWARAQLSIVNLLTFSQAVRTGFSWDLFLLEPLIFVLWCYVTLALLFVGRGVFCGWLCPFGALQELTNRAARALGVPQLALPFPLHERLRGIKVALFLLILGVSLGSLETAIRLAEVEPFKTAIVLRFWRGWPYLLWALALLAAGLFVERFFCRWLCPLGAALALPARLRQFEWLKRRWQCGQTCRICALGCPVEAIQPDGAIHPGECIWCLRCQVNFFDDRLCPPLIERRRRAQRRAELARSTAPQPPAAG